MDAQITSKKLGVKNLKKDKDKWVVTDEKSKIDFEVNVKSISVKLKNDSFLEKLIELNEKYDIKIIRENKLGFIDLVLPSNLEFYEVYNIYINSSLFSSIDINSYGKPQGNITTDVYEHLQAYLDNIAPSSFPNYHFIDAKTAWTYYENGSSNPVVVAVIGNGVDIAHQDLNIGIGAQQGYSFAYPIGSDPSPSSSMADFDRGLSHETLVAGIIGAKTNNGIGVAGIAGGWGNNLGAKIMGLRISEYSNYTLYDSGTLDDAIIYAADNGAKIINMSFVFDEITSNLAAINYAYNKGCVLIASSGNINQQGVGFPANNSKVIAVSGITNGGQWYGSYGPEIEISAAESSVYSTLRNNLYYSFNGTSATAPQASGVAALLWSYNPSFINVDIRNILNSSAIDIGDPGWDEHFGNGGVNAFMALTYADPSTEYLIPPPNNVSISGLVGSHPTISWNNSWNTESTYEIDHDNIYRAYQTDGTYYGFYKVGTVSDNGGTNYSWSDNTVSIVNPKFATSRHYYRVTSVGLNEDVMEDITMNESITSNEVSTASNWLNKNADKEGIQSKLTYSLNNNYPNPFNPTTIIKYSLKDDGFVSLKVYDVLGRIVSELVNEFQEKGEYVKTFDTRNKNLTSGVYISKITVNGFTATKKMLLTK